MRFYIGGPVWRTKVGWGIFSRRERARMISWASMRDG
jgi:hypothetical protein